MLRDDRYGNPPKNRRFGHEFVFCYAILQNTDTFAQQAEKEERDEQEKARKAEIDAKEAKKREAAAGPKKASKKK